MNSQYLIYLALLCFIVSTLLLKAELNITQEELEEERARVTHHLYIPDALYEGPPAIVVAENKLQAKRILQQFYYSSFPFPNADLKEVDMSEVNHYYIFHTTE